MHFHISLITTEHIIFFRYVVNGNVISLYMDSARQNIFALMVVGISTSFAKLLFQSDEEIILFYTVNLRFVCCSVTSLVRPVEN